MGEPSTGAGSLIIAIGELLLVACSVCYLAWWAMTFRPSGRTSSGGGLLLAGAVLCGLCGLVLLAVGIANLFSRGSAVPMAATIIGGAIVGALLVSLTVGVGHRPLTTELPLIIVWGTAQLAAGITLRTAGALTVPATTVWVVAIAIATLVGVGCYLVFYRLDPVLAYWVGMVPLAVDGLAAAALAWLALTRAG